MQISKEINLYEYICPQIIGNKLAKEVITLQLFSEPRYNEKLHILLVGDTSSGKSELLIEISKIMPNSSYSSRDVTPVGMREKLISCDGGLVIIDELDKIDKTARFNLLETMQSGTLHVDKFGYHKSCKTRVNVLASCNPRGYMLSDSMPIVSQIPFELPLITRFHLIIPFYQIDPTFYPDIAVKKNENRNDDERRRKILEYITDIKKSIGPVEIPENISRKIGIYVRDIKEMSPIKEVIGPRMIEGISSMVKAHARYNSRKEASISDFRYVKSIIDKLYMSF